MPEHPRNLVTVRARQVAAVAFMAACVGALVMGGDHPYQDGTGPGPGFFPAWVGGLGLAVGALLLFVARRTGGDEDAWTWPGGRDAARIYATVAAIVVAGLALEALGFRVTLFAFIAILLRVYGVASWPRVVAIAAVASVAVHFAFATLLKVQLPIGFLGI